MKRRTLISFIVVLAIFGLADATYLATAALTDTPLTCTIEGISGCNVVAQSPYAHVLGVPLGVYGVVFYGLFIGIALFALRKGKGIDRMLGLFAVGGAAASVWLLYVQFVLIKALCIYCLASAFVAFLLCIPAYFLIRGRESSSAPPTSAS